MTCFASASRSPIAALLRTASSTQSALRPRSCAIERANEAVKFSIFSPITPATSSPPVPTGWAAPIVVPGAIAAIFAASVINVPAEAAPAPDGATYTITGIGAPMILLTIRCAEVSRPPGVSSWITSAAAPLRAASWIESSMKSAVAGLIELLTLISSTHFSPALVDAALADAALAKDALANATPNASIRPERSHQLRSRFGIGRPSAFITS